MKRNTMVVVVLTIVILIIFGLFFVIGHNQRASIRVISPAGGEIMVTGSTQTIKWITENIPSSDKISVTIRRIPPPPLQTEGQEFDPIIFTDLSNTGSKEWIISDMYPDGKYVVGITSYNSTPVTNPVMAESADFTISKTQQNKN